MRIQSYKRMLMVLLSIVTLSQSVQAAPMWRTLVSLTFDDGLTQSAALAILAKHKMVGTFYVNSDRIDDTDYLSRAELDSLVEAGSEIGGHTINHVDLATLSDAAQRTAICDDMKNLVNWYGADQVHSFAYPFSSTGPTTQSIVAAGCSGVGTYESARAVGGLVSGTSCSSCPWSVNVPPGNPYFIATNSSTKSYNTLADLQSYVLQAEQHGGGWVPIVFHRVCDGCDTLSVSPTVLNDFLTWLEPRAAANATYVRTVHQVMAGDLPAAPPEPQLGPNLLKNPSLDLDADNNNQADCWYRSNYGTNTATWTHNKDASKAHSGLGSETVTITSYSNGDRKLLPTLDSGQAAGFCAPNVVAGQTYQLSAWYKSTAPVSLTLFYLDSGNVWQYWRDGPLYQAAGNWTQFKYYATDLPTDAKAVSFGLSLAKVGELTTDDYSLAAVTGSGVVVVTDKTPPVIASISPASGTTVSGVVSLTANVTDDTAVQQVDFSINGIVVGTDTSSPYSVAWNSTAVGNGAVNYSVKAVDTSGNPAFSGNNTLMVKNAAAAPTINFNQPPTPNAGDTVSGQVPLSANASDDIAVTKVEFLVNNVVVATVNASPYTATWNSTLNANGSASIVAKAYDGSGNVTPTAPVNVTVNNTQAVSLLSNASLETDANNDSIPDCWLQDAWGSSSNRVVWTRINGQAHSGNYAQSVQLTRYVSGDVKLLQDESNSACVPSVVVGKKYTISAWYKSTVTTSMAVFYRNSAGNWVYWLNSPNFAVTNNWAQASYTLPAVPAGATAISFGLAIAKVGTLITDDYAMTIVP
ncbi:MAG: Ig-like domain-containing protein [Methylomonas sp.]